MNLLEYMQFLSYVVVDYRDAFKTFGEFIFIA
jgi:hypothetical protein